MAAKKIKGNMLLCHFQKREAQGLDMGQGGFLFDPDSGLRTYEPWRDLIKIPEIKELFKSIVADKEADGKIDPPFIGPYKEAEKSIPEWVPAPGDDNPFFKNLASKGRGGDNIMVWLPENVVVQFGKIRGGLVENTKTGYLEFGGWLDKLRHNPIKALAEPIRVAGTIVGAYYGGPAGAGAGNALASWITGKSPKDSLMSGAKNAALVYGAQNALPYLSSMGIPGMASANSMFGATSAAGTAATAAGTAGTTAGTAGAGAAAAPASGFLSNLTGNIPQGMGLPLALMAGSGLLKMKSDKDTHRLQMEAYERQRKQQWEDMERQGLVNRFDPRSEPRRSYEAVPSNRGREDLMRGYSPEAPIRRYKKGGQVDMQEGVGSEVRKAFESYVKGPGKGQDDKVKTHVPANTYIVDASTVSMAGDGDTNSGAKNWGDWESKILSRMGVKPSKKETSSSKHPSVSVSLSAGEKELHPSVTVFLGNGDSHKGSKILEGMIRNIRADKASNKGGLPPKIKPLDSYLPRR